MSDTTVARTATPRRRGEGQWGLGYHEPLNPAEQIKKGPLWPRRSRSDRPQRSWWVRWPRLRRS